MFSSSSRGGNVVNSDGSHNVHCYMCNAFIMKTYLRLDRALCAICEKVTSGEVIPEHTLREYLSSKQDKVDVSMLLVEDEAPKDFKAKFSLRTMGGNVLRALGLAKPADVIPESVKVARGKKRPRLFENVDLDASMTAIDEELKKKK